MIVGIIAEVRIAEHVEPPFILGSAIYSGCIISRNYGENSIIDSSGEGKILSLIQIACVIDMSLCSSNRIVETIEMNAEKHVSPIVSGNICASRETQIHICVTRRQETKLQVLGALESSQSIA